jgi:ectoine hydroxylase-related dioxygenase (phytanoyl-CoA dioxygenase family)
VIPTEPFVVDAETITEFRERGHTVVRGLVAAPDLAPYRDAIESDVAGWAAHLPPSEERDTYQRAFVQAPNVWMRNELVRELVWSPRLAGVAAALLGVDAVRLYHDQALVKEAGGGHTPWHQDQRYWPLDADATITMWMPLVDVSAEVGTMTFADGSHRHRELGPWVIGDESESHFADVVAARGFATTTHGALRAGDATFHAGWTLHRAPANPTGTDRPVMTVIWFADGTRVGPVGPTQRLDHVLWLAEIPSGEPAAGPLNPVLWPPS